MNSEYRSLRGSCGSRWRRSRASSSSLAALAVVARLARRDQVLPRVAATAMARHDVVEGQVVALAAAVLAGVPVPGEDLAPAQLDPRARPPDEVLEADDRGRAVLRPRRPDHLVVVLDHFGLVAEHEPEGPWQVADVERLVILVQYEHDAVHGSRRIARFGGGLSPGGRAPGRWVPAAGLSDLRRERPAQGVGDEPRCRERPRRGRRRGPSRRHRGSRRGPPWRGCRRPPGRTGNHRSRRSRCRTSGCRPRDPSRRWPTPSRACRGSGRPAARRRSRPPRPGPRPPRPGRGRRRRSCPRSRSRRRPGPAGAARHRRPPADRPAPCTGSRTRSTRTPAATSRARRPGPGPARRRPAMRRPSSRCWPS